MHRTTAIPRSLLLLSLVLGAACDDATETSSADQTQSGYQFVDAKSWKLVDTLGVPLQSTALTNRDDGYNDAAPYGAKLSQKGILLTYREYLARMHMWADDAGLLGAVDLLPGQDFTPCAEELGLDCDANKDGCVTAVIPCTLHEIAQEGQTPRSTLSVIFPDHLTIDVTEKPGFPNGRPVYRLTAQGELIYEQINDLVLAMGFLAMGEVCTADPTGICTVRTFSDMKNPDGSRGLNKQENDVPFRTSFPFLGAPHQPGQG